ncbi:M23 family metallopeptidase [Streptomyces sp. SID9727]|uniref:M23 family metallopeptidase n=1 Tax=Streptomyces sp. SID9727 TaxID=2706114 RepID=UPI0013C8AF49|nr:M23 family metallopeptidase [Streptomyces sp. SID9727]NEC68936.1 M23 family metallopeptidase [Streptomyces sp. SID9727]
MAFTRATGKHRAPSRLTRGGAKVVGVATLAACGVIGSLASPALAADAGTAPAATETGLSQLLAIENTLADRIDAQAKEAAKAKAEATREASARAGRSTARTALGSSYRLPVAGSYVTTGYKSSGSLWSSGSHSGIDFHAASGSSVVAVGAGTVVEAGWGGAYGNNIVLRMADGTYTQYGHLSSIGVSVGQSVAAGQQIGLSGSTGNSTGPHLHFEARTTPSYGSDMDPVAYLRAHGVSV